MPRMVDAKLLELVRCPDDLSQLVEDGETLRCSSCGRRYPVRDGIPILIVEEAEGGESSGDSSKEAPKE